MNDTNSDVYFTPLSYREPSRKKALANSSPWLYADLDPVDPRRISLKPTIAWQTSPGNFQAMWRLSRSVAPTQHSDLNQRLTYAVGADKGGWHLTKVLRLPGTYNHKYNRRTQVRLLWINGPIYTQAEIREFVKGVAAHNITPDLPGLVLPAESRASIINRYKHRFDNRTRLLISDNDSIDRGPEGRSGLLWELECRLLESGLETEEVFVVVRESVWNKFKERENGERDLWREVRKAHLHTGTQQTNGEHDGIPGQMVRRMRPRIVSYADILGTGISEPGWLVEDWWTLGSHGVVAGLPKSYKSLVTLDLAVSVASESDFLGQFAVNPKGVGPVLVIQQENSLPLLRDRLLKITSGRGLNTGRIFAGNNDTSVVVEFPSAIPLLFYNDYAFDMSMPDDREAVEEIIQKEGMRMVVFDPLYLMIGGADENQAKEMRPILSWLLRLRNLYSCAVVVVHHWGKGTTSRGGRGVGGIRLLGSTTIYGWLEAALYLESEATEQGFQVVVEREFRERLSPPPTAFNLNMGDIGDNAYEWARAGAVGTTNRLIWVIEQAAERGATYAEINEKLESKIGQKTLRKEIDQLIEAGVITMEQDEKTRQKRFYSG